MAKRDITTGVSLAILAIACLALFPRKAAPPLEPPPGPSELSELQVLAQVSYRDQLPLEILVTIPNCKPCEVAKRQLVQREWRGLVMDADDKWPGTNLPVKVRWRLQDRWPQLLTFDIEEVEGELQARFKSVRYAKWDEPFTEP